MTSQEIIQLIIQLYEMGLDLDEIKAIVGINRGL